MMQQQILMPASNQDELAFLREIVRRLQEDQSSALPFVMARLAMLERISGSRLVNFDPVAERSCS